MKRRVFIIHGWGGNSGEEWLVWVGKELEKKGFEVSIPDMPDTSHPTIKNWVNKLNEIVGEADPNTYFIGHSIGCQAIMRYLEQLDDSIKIGGSILVAGWFNLTDETWDEDYTKEIANEWIETPINFDRLKIHTNNFVLINSDNDPYVPVGDIELFKDSLNTDVVLLEGKGHIAGDDGVTELPIVLEKLLEIGK